MGRALSIVNGSEADTGVGEMTTASEIMESIEKLQRTIRDAERAAKGTTVIDDIMNIFQQGAGDKNSGDTNE